MNISAGIRGLVGMAYVGPVMISVVGGGFGCAPWRGVAPKPWLERLPITLTPVDEDVAIRSALMINITRPQALSLGDRICLAQGQRTGQTVLTADKDWAKIAANVGATVELVR